MIINTVENMKWYKLMNYLFKWDYILWENCLYKGVSRVRFLPDGELYYLEYGTYGTFNLIKGNKEVKQWLTCSKEKYRDKL